MKTTKKDLLDAGCHFGHLTRKWNPKMAPYIFAEKNGIHIIDLNKSYAQLEKMCEVLKGMAANGKRMLFVATKKQAREIVSNAASSVKMPFVTERWLGGMLTNFATIRRSLNKMSAMERMIKDNSFANLEKRERLMKAREKEKLTRILGGISNERRLPHLLIVLDVKKEHIAIKEAKKLGIPIFAIADTNSDPDHADHFVVANDDAYKSIQLLISTITTAIQEGLDDKKSIQETNKAAGQKEDLEKEDNAEQKTVEKVDVEKEGEVASKGEKKPKKVGKDAVKIEVETKKDDKATSKEEKKPKRVKKTAVKVEKETKKDDKPASKEVKKTKTEGKAKPKKK